MKLLIDGDIIAYRSAAACDGRQYVIRYNSGGTIISIVEKYKKDADSIEQALIKEGHEPAVTLEYEPEPLQNAKFLLDKSVESILKECEKEYGVITDMNFYLSIGGSFREKEFPSYKSNRASLRRPHHLGAMKDYLKDKYGAVAKEGELEADDMMAMNQTDDTVIVTIDKDLLQVPGLHYNFVKKVHRTIDVKEGTQLLYKQMLTGDSTDGIPGIKGIGPKTAEKLIDPCSSEFLMYLVVLKAYYDKTPREEDEEESEFQIRVAAMVRAHARLLYLLRTEGDSWEPPEESV